MQRQGDDMKQPTADINRKKLTKSVIKAQKGDKRAKEQIVELTYGYVYYYCLKMLRNKENAKDATLSYVQVIKADQTTRTGWAFY